MKTKSLFIYFTIVMVGIAILISSQLAIAQTVTKGLIGKQDVHLWYSDDSTSTFTRETSTGYDITLNQVDWVGIDVFQVYGFGVNSNSTVLQAAIDDAGSETVEFLLSPTSGDWECTANVTFPSNVTLKIMPGARLDPDAGMTAAINGPFKAGLYQVFTGAGTISFGSGAVSEVPPQWFGDIDGTADEAQINLALDSLPAGPTTENATIDYTDGGCVKLSRGDWAIDSPIIMDSFQRLVGSGPSTVLNGTSTNSAIILIGADDNAFHIRINIEDMTIQGPGSVYSAGGYGIHGYAVHKSYFKNLWINRCTDSGIYLQGSSYMYIQNSYLENNKGYGVHLVSVPADSYLYTTASHIESSTIKYSGKAGVKLKNAIKTYINDNTIEYNCLTTPEKIGTEAALQTDDDYYMNLIMEGSHSSTVESNYFEHGATYGVDDDHRVNIAVTVAQNCYIEGNAFVTGVGVFIWGADSQSPWYNWIVRNRFDNSRDDNLVLDKDEVADNVPYYNHFLDNQGVRLSEYSTPNDPWKNYWAQSGIEDGLKYSSGVTTIGAATYTPDFGITDVDNIASGRANPRIIIMTLTGNATIAAPVPAGVVDFYVTYIFIQDAGGGNTVSWAGAYKNEWSDVGNVGDAISSITFYGATTGTIYQIGAQSGYY